MGTRQRRFSGLAPAPAGSTSKVGGLSVLAFHPPAHDIVRNPVVLPRESSISSSLMENLFLENSASGTDLTERLVSISPVAGEEGRY